MNKIAFIGILIVFAFLFSHVSYAGNCDEGKVIPNTDKCKDTDNGKNYWVYGVCRDYKDWNKEWKDYCDGSTLTEYYCSDSGRCVPEGRDCENGCIQNAPACMLPGKIIDYPHNGCDDTDNGIFYYKAGICTDGLQEGGTPTEHKDTCNGNYLVEWHCSQSYPDAGSLHSNCPPSESANSNCIQETEYCDFGCKDGACIKPDFGDVISVVPGGGNQENNAEVKCCLNPASDVCSATTKEECCPDNGDYGIANGPKNKEDCEQNYFVAGSVEDAPCIGLKECTAGCCCERTYNGDKVEITADPNSFKGFCKGKDKIFTVQGCSKARCEMLFSEDKESKNINSNVTNLNSNNSNESITSGYQELCKPGQCKDSFVCLKDFDKNEMRCCNASECLAQGLCFQQWDKLYRHGREYVCVDSKWQATERRVKRLVSPERCEEMHGTCRGNFLWLRGLLGFLFRGGNFCNIGEYDYSSCGKSIFGDARCCIPKDYINSSIIS